MGLGWVKLKRVCYSTWMSLKTSKKIALLIKEDDNTLLGRKYGGTK